MCCQWCLRRAATIADNWIPGPTADLARLEAGRADFLSHRAAAGRTHARSDALWLGAGVHVGRTCAYARRPSLRAGALLCGFAQLSERRDDDDRGPPRRGGFGGGRDRDRDGGRGY